MVESVEHSGNHSALQGRCISPCYFLCAPLTFIHVTTSLCPGTRVCFKNEKEVENKTGSHCCLKDAFSFMMAFSQQNTSTGCPHTRLPSLSNSAFRFQTTPVSATGSHIPSSTPQLDLISHLAFLCLSFPVSEGGGAALLPSRGCCKNQVCLSTRQRPTRLRTLRTRSGEVSR